MTTKPYFGATGFMNSALVDQVRQFVHDNPLIERRLMVAMLVSSRTLRGEQPSHGWAGRYPVAQYPDVWTDAEAIWSSPSGRAERGIWKVVHYNTNRPNWVGDLGQIVRTIPSTQAIQLNLVNPSVKQLRTFREVHADVEIILQVGSRVLAQFEAPDDLDTYLSNYAGLAEYVLLDPSGGLGQEFNMDQLKRLLRHVPWDDLKMLPGVAGGLSADNVGRLRPLLADWPHLGWDAEGRLMGDEGLDPKLTLDYLAASYDILALHGAV